MSFKTERAEKVNDHNFQRVHSPMQQQVFLYHYKLQLLSRAFIWHNK
jgi:hypothetical protein